MIYAIGLLLAYFGILAVLSLIARPYRARLLQLGNELLRDYPDDKMLLGMVNAAIGSAYSMRAAPVRLLSFVIGILTPAEKLDEGCEELVRDHPDVMNDIRLYEMLDCYLASIAAVNPIFGALAYLARGAFKLKAVIHRRKLRGEKLSDYVEMKAFST